jgi:hypothetical protein
MSRTLIPDTCNVTLTSAGDNIGNDTCVTESTALNDRWDLNPKLGALTNNGGPTQTMALQAGSPAIDAVTVNTATCTGTDPRGRRRVIGSACDIGAYELDTDTIFADGFN